MNSIARPQVILLFFFFSLFAAFGQRTPSVPKVTLIPSISHLTCFSSEASIDYAIEVSNGWVKGCAVNSLVLKDEAGNTVYVHSGTGPTGTVTGLGVGMYTFTGSVTVKNSLGYFVSVLVSRTVWVGIETSWKDLTDMSAQPNSYSATRTAMVNTYGGAQSFNYIASGNGWVEMQADFGGTTSSEVYWLVEETQSTTSFNPSGAVQYVKFYSTSSGSGILVRYLNSGVYTTTAISTNKYDKVRLYRNGTTLTLQLNDLASTVFTFPSPDSGPMNIGVFARMLNDVAVNVVSSFPCVYDNQYFYLKNQVEETVAYVSGNKVRFRFEEDYFDPTGVLSFEIRDLSNSTGAVMSGSLTKDDHVDFYQITNNAGGITLTSGKTYLLTVVNAKGRKSYLKFKKA